MACLKARRRLILYSDGLVLPSMMSGRECPGNASDHALATSFEAACTCRAAKFKPGTVHTSRCPQIIVGYTNNTRTRDEDYKYAVRKAREDKRPLAQTSIPNQCKVAANATGYSYRSSPPSTRKTTILWRCMSRQLFSYSIRAYSESSSSIVSLLTILPLRILQPVTIQIRSLRSAWILL